MRLRFIWPAALIASGLCACGGGYERPQFAEHTPPPNQHLLGTADPYTVDMAAKDGRFIVLCQAREDTNQDGRIEVSLGYHGDTYGDLLLPYFIRDHGPGERFDELIAVGAHERQLLVVARPDLLLIDTQAGRSVALPNADVDNRPLRARVLDPRPSAFGVFGSRGKKAAYEKRGDSIKIGIRDLLAHTEIDIDAGPGELGHMSFDTSEQWLTVLTAPADTDKNGRIEFPENRTTLAPEACRGPVMSFSVGPARGDDVKAQLVHIESGKVLETPPGWIGTLGDSMLIRAPDQSLVSMSVDGTKKTIVSPECAGTLLWAHEEPLRLMAVCKDNTLQWITPENTSTTPKTLRRMQKPPTRDRLRWERGPLVYLRDGEIEFFVDVSSGTGMVVELKPGARVLAHFEKQILAIVDQHFVWLDLQSGEIRELPMADADQDTWVERQSGPAVAVKNRVIDLAQGRIIGRYEPPLLGLDSRGRILQAANVYVSGGKLGRGPLWWEPLRPP